MRKLTLLLGVAGIVAFLTGCPPTYPTCKSDKNCEERGELCVQGQCQECATDAHCKAGFVCQAQKCVPKPECTPGGDECGSGQRCRAGKCIVHECETNQECGTGRCQNNRCVSGCTQDEDCPSGQSCRQGQCTAAAAGEGHGGDQCSFEAVHFEFNEAQLSAEARSRLERLADCIKRQNLRLAVEGHADERGTEEYNLQLSNRRAESVRRYLVNLGVAAGRIETLGYGENRPLQHGSNDAAWAANRRVEFSQR